jgi:ankyrin repeat protein
VAAWFAAVKAGDLPAVAALLAAGAHRCPTTGSEVRCERGGTALMWACAEGRTALATLLLADGGADVEARCSRAGGTPLIWAASRNQSAALALLLAAGADPGRPAVPPDDTRGVWNVEVRV